MKSTGIVRKLDTLGRVVIPIELRRTLKIGDNDGLEIYVDQDRIILRKYEPACACVFCGSGNGCISHKGKMICNDCLESMRSQVI